MKYKRKEFRKRACCHVSVIAYAQNYGEEKNVLKKIEEVSKLSGISKRALQYYDDEGLLRVKRSKYSSCRCSSDIDIPSIQKRPVSRPFSN